MATEATYEDENDGDAVQKELVKTSQMLLEPLFQTTAERNKYRAALRAQKNSKPFVARGSRPPRGNRPFRGRGARGAHPYNSSFNKPSHSKYETKHYKYHEYNNEESRREKPHHRRSPTPPRRHSRSPRRSYSPSPPPGRSHHSRSHGSPSRSLKRSPSDLPNKMYEANCSVVLIKDLLRCGVAMIDISDGNSAYCFFDRKSLVTPVSDKEKLSIRVRKGDKMKINAWLLDEKAKIPYLASTIWMPGIRVSSSLMDSILTLPDMRHMEKFHNLSREMAWQLKEREREEDVRGSDIKQARVEFKARSGSGRYEELERPGLGLELEPIPQPDQAQAWPKRGGRVQMAIGRNVFIDSDEEKEKNDQARGRGRGRTRGRGRAMAIGRNVFSDEPGRGRGTRGGRHPRGYGRIKRSERMKSRSEAIGRMYSDRIHRGDTPEEVDPGEEELEDISSDDDGDSAARSEINPPATTSRISYPEKYIGTGGIKVPEELLVTVIEYPHEQVGLLQGSQHANVLFHINQVWVNHSSAGFCPFREIYPTVDLTKHFYLGKVVKCFARAVPDCNKVSLQATAVWIEGDPPQESLGRAETEALLPELDFHLRAYLSSSYCQLSTPPEFQKGHPAVIQEYISHEMGLAKLRRGDRGVVLFHLDQIWHLTSGQTQWGLYKDVQKYPLSSHHLPIGTNVMVATRTLSVSQNSRLRYQATALWHQDDCPGMTEDGLPPPYLKIYSHLDKQADLVKSLDGYHDNLKRLCEFQLRSINPVPAILNLLPEDWTASVCKIVDADYGIIKITHRKDEDMSGPAGLNVKRIFAIFHVEDVYNISGDPFRSPGLPPIMDLLNYPVDLTARSIVDEVSGPGVLNTIAKQIILPAQFSHVACPVLQAVSVFMKPQQSLEANISRAPVPTFLRKCPAESFHKVSTKHPSTAFYLNIVLQMKLDVKALNFFSTVTANKLQKEINNGLAMAFFNKTKKNITVDKQDQMKLLKEMSILDPNHKERLIYGSFKPFLYPPVPHAFLAPVIQATPCHIQLLCREGLAARSGIVRFNLPNGMTTYSFFDTSSYKFSLQREARVADMAELMQVCSDENFMFTGMLINPGSQIPYACTTLWKVSKWSKEPECALRQMDSRFVQKYERVTSQIVAEWTNLESPKETQHALTPKAPMAQYPVMSSSSAQPKISLSLPTPVPIVIPDPIVRPPPRQVWATAEKITNRIGRVTSIIDGNYGLAVVKYRPSEECYEIHTAIVLFDTCDLWLSADLGQPQVASNLGVSISDVMTERDHVKLNAIMVPESDNQKNIRYIATSLITDTDKAEIRRRNIPEMAPIENLDQIHPEKINNFYAVVSAICQNIPGEPEDEIKDVSSDEADVNEMMRTKALAVEILRAAGQAKANRSSSNSEERFHGNSGDSTRHHPNQIKFKIASSDRTRVQMNSQPKKEFLDDDFLSTEAHLKSLVSLDAFEAEREKKKLAKKNECLQNRRKMSYSREAREILLEEMKLRNQLLWNCDRCHVTMGKEAMEAHLKNQMHWDNIENRYSKALDSIYPPNASNVRERKEAVYLMEMGNKINVN